MNRPSERYRRAPNGAASCALAALATLLAVLTAAREATAQDPRPFALTDFGGYAEVGFLADVNRRSRANSRNSNFERFEFSQLLNLTMDAFVYHPWFLDIAGRLELKTLQDVADTGGNRILAGGDLRLNFLQEHDTSLSLYTKISQSEYARPFTDTFSVTRQLYGATLYQKTGWLPFDLSYQHRIQDGGVDNILDEIEDSVDFLGSYQLSERSEGRLEYRLAFKDVFGRNSRREEVRATNFSRFGERRQNRLSTSLYFTEKNDLNQWYNLVGQVDYDWRHTDDLSTRYDFDVRWNESGPQTVTILRPSFMLRHQLYESLATQFEAYASIEDASYSSRNDFGARLAENYSKTLGDWGKLAISIAPRVQYTSTRPEQDTASAINEVHVMLWDQPSILRIVDVITSSIVVTNEDETFVFREGRDYEVRTVGTSRQTELLLTARSRIEEGETVLVDYEYALLGDSDILTAAADFSTSLWFYKHFRVYGRYQIHEPQILAGDEETLRIDTFHRAIAGVEIDWPWFAMNARYENYDATFGPFEAFTGNLSLFTYGTQAWQARGSTGYSSVKYTDSDIRVNRATASATASIRPFRRGLFELETNYLRERWQGMDGPPNNRDEMFVGADFTFSYGQFELGVDTGMAVLLRPAEDKLVYQIDFRLRRSF